MSTSSAASGRGRSLLKGILHPGEAKAALEHGIDGLIVSNHGGRQLDGAPAAHRRSARRRSKRSRGRIPVLVDGGIRRGADVVKALALGAAACLIGRPHLWGLAVAGEAGVAHVLDIYRREIDRVIGLCGVGRIADIGPDIIFRRPGSIVKVSEGAPAPCPCVMSDGFADRVGTAPARLCPPYSGRCVRCRCFQRRLVEHRHGSAPLRLRLERLDGQYDRLVDRAGDAEHPRLGEQGAIERVDLGAAALLDVLQHRGAVVALPGMVEDGAAGIGIGQRDALGCDDREHLVEDAFEELPRRLRSARPRRSGGR